MKFICNQCAKVFQADDVTVHYKKGGNGFEIVAICQLCLKEYLEKIKVDADRKEEDIERGKIIRKW